MNFLPAKFKSKHSPLLFFLSCCGVIALLFFSILNIEKYTKEVKVLGTKIESSDFNVTNEIAYWESFLIQNPSYFVGWLELYSLTKNEVYLQKAKEINPNYF